MSNSVYIPLKLEPNALLTLNVTTTVTLYQPSCHLLYLPTTQQLFHITHSQIIITSSTYSPNTTTQLQKPIITLTRINY